MSSIAPWFGGQSVGVGDGRPLESIGLGMIFGRTNKAMEPGCVQFDFHFMPAVPVPRTSYAQQAAPGRAAPRGWSHDTELAYDGVNFDRASELIMEDNARFSNRRKAGWFTLAGAFLAAPEGTSTDPTWRGKPGNEVEPLEMVLEGTLDAPRVPIPDEILAEERRTGRLLDITGLAARFAGDKDQPLHFALSRRTADNRLEFHAHCGLIETFDSGDGNAGRMEQGTQWYTIAHYFPEGKFSGHLRIGGSGTGFSAAASSPLLNGHYAGQVCVYTWSETHFVGEALSRQFSPEAPPDKTVRNLGALHGSTLAHELCHSLGAPHQCGHWAYRHFLGFSRSCQMNYAHYPVRRRGRFVEWSINKMGDPEAPEKYGDPGPVLCGVHYAQMRKLVLQENPSFAGAEEWRS